MARVHRFTLSELRRVVAEIERLQNEWGKVAEIAMEDSATTRIWAIGGEKEGQVVEFRP